MTTFLDIARKIGDFLSPLMELAARFRGFLALVAFVVIAGLALFILMFSQGSFDAVLDNFKGLPPQLFFFVVMFTLSGFFGLTMTLVVLGYLKEASTDTGTYTLHVIVHKEGDVTEPVAGATVTLVLDEAISGLTNERGGVSFTFGKQWLDQACEINAKHPHYKTRPATSVRLRPRARALIALEALANLPSRPSSSPRQGIENRKMASTPEPTPQAEEAPAGDSLFVTGNAVKEDNFFGRREALKLISGRIGGELQSVSIVANRRMGKTSLLNYVTKRYPQLFPARHTWAFAYMDMMDVRTHTAAGVMRILRRGIAGQLGRDLWDEKYDGNLAVMAEKYEELAEAQVRLVLCLDEWDSVMAHPELNDLIEQLRASGSRSRIGMIVATAHELSDLTARGGLSSPFYNIFEVVYLSLMPEAEWTTLARKMFERGGREASASQIALIGELAGGHPNLTQLAGSVVWDAHSQSWAETQIREVYAHKARPVFQGLWSRQSEVQKDVMRQVLGLKRAASAPKEVWDELKRRGVLTKSGDLFCKPFADFVRSQEPV